MLEFITKYWLEFLLSIVTSGITFFARHYYKLYKKEKEDKSKELISNIKTIVQENTVNTETALKAMESRLREEDKNIYSHLEEVKTDFQTLKNGLLSLHRTNFLNECRRLIDKEEPITLQEYEHILKEYHTYKQLGGNDRGDAMYRLVESKYQKELSGIR